MIRSRNMIRNSSRGSSRKISRRIAEVGRSVELVAGADVEISVGVGAGARVLYLISPDY